MLALEYGGASIGGTPQSRPAVGSSVQFRDKGIRLWVIGHDGTYQKPPARLLMSSAISLWLIDAISASSSSGLKSPAACICWGSGHATAAAAA